jgi:GNAT superfamily N-acetyltransferase
MRSLQSLGPREATSVVCPWCGRTPTRGERGVQAVREGRTLGVLILAAGDPERDLCPPGASVIERLWVAPEDVGEHVGTQLLQRACAQLVSEGARWLVANGTTGRPDCGRLPAGWLAKAGFVEHVRGSQWRIELRRTVVWADVLGDAAASVTRIIQPEPRARPVGRAHLPATVSPPEAPFGRDAPGVRPLR